MLKEERYDKILEIIEEENYITAHALSKRLYVSLPTIRRDLSELQRRNLILRSHGGARKISGEHILMPLDFRKTQNHIAKRNLCKKAVKMINDNDIVFIDASTTALQIVDFLEPKKPITVVTNSIPLSIALGRKGIKSYCTGGELQESSLGYAGSYAEDFVRNFNFDIMFFSCSGVNDRGMIVDVSLTETQLRKTVLKVSKRAVFLCDESKFGVTAPYNMTDVGEVVVVS